MTPKIIAVFGATGAQGGGLVRAILNDSSGEFKARAVTRDPNSEKAKALAAGGAEVVQADLDDEASIAKALEGAYGAYCVTNFWEHYSADKEETQAKNLAEACKAAGVQHVIWSTLEDTRNYYPLDDDRMPTLQGKFKVPHFDGKGASDHFFSDLGLPVTFLRASFYWDNFIHFGSGPQRGPDGTLAITFPIGDTAMAGVAAEDIGKTAFGIFKSGPSMVGKYVGIAGDFTTGDQFAEAFSKVLGEKVNFNAIEPAAYRALGFPGADDLGNMFQFYRDYANEFRTLRDVDLTKQLNPSVQNFDQWLEAHKGELSKV